MDEITSPAPRSAPQPPPTGSPEAPVGAPPRLHRRFDRTARLLGESAMEKLARAHVIVFGMGGVGSFAAEGLARSGVGRLTLVDFDQICVTNVNRQLHAMKGTLGRFKAEVMAERLQLVSPDARIDAVNAFYSAEEGEALLPADATYVVDCIDNVKAKLNLLARCVEKKLPVVSSMGAAGRLDPTAVRVSDLCETHSDHFAKDVRKYLKVKYGLDTSRPTGIAAVWSVEKARDPIALDWDADGFLCVCPHKDNALHTCDHRTVINGTASFVTSVFGMTAASVVVRRIAGA